MSTHAARILLIGYGNPGRRDDGLGPALACAVERLALPGVTVEADYQLNLEDAEAIARHGVVVFADAARTGPEPFAFRPLAPRHAIQFSSHSVAPAALLGLAEELFGARTEGYVLGLRGYEFDEFTEALSPRAEKNLAAAIAFIESVVRDRSFRTACLSSEAEDHAGGTPSPSDRGGG